MVHRPPTGRQTMAQKGERHRPETLEKMRASATARWKGKRLRDVEATPGRGVYSTREYQEARKTIMGRPCAACASTEKIHAHHLVPGDDSTLIPLCVSCHAKAHHSHANVNGKSPPPGAIPPLCACGCGRPVLWKRVRGWGEYLRGHGSAKIPAGTSSGPAPLCGCGCGEPVKFRHGRGWNQYRRGHGQRVEGHYRMRVA